MALEIERKFLVNGDFRNFASASYEIVQGYLSHNEGNTVRVRVQGDKAFLTIKGKSQDGGLSRLEWEYSIPLSDGQALFGLCQGALIEKTRYIVPVHTFRFEVDEFHGENAGLYLAELELPQPDSEFPRPIWLGREVTGQRRFYNAMLVKNPYANWKD
jgi:adenylate cyclase